MTVKIRLEALPGTVTAAVLWLKAAGAKLTGITHLYPKGNSDELRVYAVLTPPINADNSEVSDRQVLAHEARQAALSLRAEGNSERAAYYEGLADGLEM